MKKLLVSSLLFLTPLTANAAAMSEPFDFERFEPSGYNGLKPVDAAHASIRDLKARGEFSEFMEESR